MGKVRRERRKLARLSKNPNYIKPYNAKVRQHNGKVREIKQKDRKYEQIVSLTLLAIGIVWILMNYTK